MSPSKVQAELPDYQYPAETQETLEYAELEALDISKLDQPGGKDLLAQQVLGFINKKGFFYVVGHGFSDEQVRRQYALCREFFNLPLDEKLKYAADTARGDFRGYKPQSTGKLAARDNDERYNIPKFTAEHAREHPSIIAQHLEEIRAFSRKVHDDVLLPLLRLFARVLELDDEEYLARRHRYEAPGLEYLRYMQYFPRAAEADARVGNIWARGHTDYNTLTFLFHQPVAGLQVLAPEDGAGWQYVRSPRDAIIVNIADALEFLSGGYLKSTVHRVVRPPEDQADRSRYSLIYFARPESNVTLKPVSSPLLQRLGLQSGREEFKHDVTAEEWALARIAKDHRFRVGIVDTPKKEIIAGVNQKFYH
ncbi:putative 1-aminocyclopropane-1-carboxylate oxidase [Xylariomycetidae sp. FL2044]|nr:putative 1-aminocyclopropane-1-carboxylate oxidase [Xylariomycetidae sp. FL2044]